MTAVYAGEAGAALRRAEIAAGLSRECDIKRSLLPWWRFGKRRAMDDNAAFWANEARRHCAASARIDGEGGQ